MLIRSQDKTSISTDLNAWIKKGTTDFFIENRYIILGHYSTEEKAIKVLDMIQNAYSSFGTFEDKNGTIINVLTFPKVFQMPQDEDVEV